MVHISPINSQVPDRLVELARQIAQNAQYPVLIHGLQPLEDYRHEGNVRPGLRSKYQAELLELRDALRKERVWQHSEAADLLYYASAIDESERLSGIARSAHGHYQDALATLAGPSCQIDQEEAEAAALAKYSLRASAPNNKCKETPEEKAEREAQENAAIQAAIDALVPAELWPGWPLTEVAEMYGVPVDALYYATGKLSFPVRKAGPRITLIDIRSPQFRLWLRVWKQNR